MAFEETLPFIAIFAFFLIPLFFIAIGIASLVFWIIMLIDVVKRDFRKEDDKILWVLVVVLAGVIGAIIYYFVVKRKDKK
jgi:uncharacterized membrane protein